MTSSAPDAERTYELLAAAAEQLAAFRNEESGGTYRASLELGSDLYRTEGLTALFLAFDRIMSTTTPETRSAAALLKQAVSNAHDPEELLTCFADYTLTGTPSVVRALAENIVGVAVPYRIAMKDSDVPGRLDKAIYDLIFQDKPRHPYLVKRIDRHRPLLSRDQRRLARTLALDWSGTLPALLETVIALRPDCPPEH
jgi:hypothetical protein